ncbi:MAG: aldehyde dehydrogenase, partial [Actinomycetota bacterium]|nr:aldehyde dehydrogenase [Actinomycetota bacterium]
MVSQLVEAPKSGEVRDYKMLVGGEWVDARSGKTFESVNPYTGRAWATVPEADDDDVDQAVRAARAAFDEGPWGKMTGTERARLMRHLADLLAENAQEIAAIESTDNGKLLREMGGQLKALPEWYYYFAGAADKVQGETIPSDKPNFFVYTRREPIGVVGAITPWNSPLLLLTFKLAPALAAGCTFVVKTAEQTPASTLEFARLFDEAGFPPGVFNVVTGYGPTTGRALVRNPGVDKVAFTGSTETGKQVMKDAADHLAKVTLELGGKSPQIVFDDADPEAVANGVVSGIFAATGQTCIAGSRLFVQKGLHDELVERLAEKAASIKLGDPLEMETEMGPVAFREQLEKVQGYIETGTREGAELVGGGKRPDTPDLRDGFFMEPTILAGVTNDMTVAREEIFGPVLSVIPAESEEEVVRQANDTPYGLAAGVWT